MTTVLRYEDGDEVLERPWVLHWHTQDGFRSLAEAAGLAVQAVLDPDGTAGGARRRRRRVPPPATGTGLTARRVPPSRGGRCDVHHRPRSRSGPAGPARRRAPRGEGRDRRRRRTDHRRQPGRRRRAAHRAPTPPASPAPRAAGARIVGKANLHELCFGATGVNAWSGTPTNPLDPARVPGGSSSGSAVAVATGSGRRRVRHRHHRLAPQPGGLLWCRRPPPHLGTHPARRHPAARADARHGRPPRPHRRRRRRRPRAPRARASPSPTRRRRRRSGASGFPTPRRSSTPRSIGPLPPPGFRSPRSSCRGGTPPTTPAPRCCSARRSPPTDTLWPDRRHLLGDDLVERFTQAESIGPGELGAARPDGSPGTPSWPRCSARSG